MKEVEEKRYYYAFYSPIMYFVIDSGFVTLTLNKALKQ